MTSEQIKEEAANLFPYMPVPDQQSQWRESEEQDFNDEQDNARQIFQAGANFALSDMQWRRTADGLPEKPGLKSYEQIPCLCKIKGDTILLMWNCEDKVWDNEDDFYYTATDVDYYLPLSALPGIKK